MLSSQKIGSLGLSLEDAFSMVGDAWRSVSNESLTWIGMGFGDPEARRCASLVRIEGAWGGYICIDCAAEYAQYVLGQIYGKSSETIEDCEIYDLLGETANILGGMIKGAIGQGCHLSLPHRINIEHLNGLIESARLVCSFQCTAGQGLFVVSILED